ncbi:MAG: DUF2784 family protein [Acidobacteriota bacterium]|nr:DUF2784 family protein [Acidobacteriota bacterium]
MKILNLGLFVLHTSWIAFNCLGWAWRRTRRWQLLTLTLTALSWFGLGIWYGWGYCPFTDWHWQVRSRLGYADPPSSTTSTERVVSDPERTARFKREAQILAASPVSRGSCPLAGSLASEPALE